MAKSMRCKREKRLRAIKREMVAPIYEKKEEAKLAALEAAMNAPKLPVRTRPDESAAMDASTLTAADMVVVDVEMDEGNQTAKSLKPMGRKLKKKLKLNKKKYRGKGKIRKKNV